MAKIRDATMKRFSLDLFSKKKVTDENIEADPDAFMPNMEDDNVIVEV